MKQKINYFLRSLRNSFQEKKCPDCGNNSFALIDQKYFVTTLLKCNNCRLKFRFPVDSVDFLNKFYQSDYKANYCEITEGITDLPSPEELKEMMLKNFPAKRNYAPFIKALFKSAPAKVVDYGCSWGYSVFQIQKEGYDVEGFEISKPRAEFGKNLGVNIHHDYTKVRKDNDLLLNSHVIEHLHGVSQFIRYSASILKDDGIFMAFCPNGSDEFRKRNPSMFHVNWGFLHPNYLDIEFAQETFKKNPYVTLP